MTKVRTPQRPTGRFEPNVAVDEPTPILENPDLQPPLAEGEDCLICIYGADLGQRFDLDVPRLVIGRDVDCDIPLNEDTVSRNHAVIERLDLHRVVTDLDSTNGVFVNSRKVKVAHLNNGDHVRLGRVILKYLAGGNVERIYHEEIRRLTIEDGLTRTANKRFMMWYLDREFQRSFRHDRPFSLLLIDIDHFKRINDVYGHLAGDEVLAKFAEMTRPRIRKDECLARYGGDEFALLLNETDLDGARTVAEALRAMIREHEFVVDGQAIPVTVSIGVAQRTEAMEDPSELLKQADAGLLKAKTEGRNRVR